MRQQLVATLGWSLVVGAGIATGIWLGSLGADVPADAGLLRWTFLIAGGATFVVRGLIGVVRVVSPSATPTPAQPPAPVAPPPEPEPIETEPEPVVPVKRAPAKKAAAKKKAPAKKAAAKKAPAKRQAPRKGSR